MTDPIADLLTRMRNAVRAGRSTCDLPASRVKEHLARILQQEGYVEAVTVRAEGGHRVLSVTLRRRPGGEHVLRGLRRVSRPGRRVYTRGARIPKVLGGLGMSIVSTSRGLLTDAAARESGLGGEIICNVW
jgi:small subunit ribosomal protein S8